MIQQIREIQLVIFAFLTHKKTAQNNSRIHVNAYERTFMKTDDMQSYEKGLLEF